MSKCENCKQERPDVRIVHLGEWCMPFLVCEDCVPSKKALSNHKLEGVDWRPDYLLPEDL